MMTLTHFRGKKFRLNPIYVQAMLPAELLVANNEGVDSQTKGVIVLQGNIAYHVRETLAVMEKEYHRALAHPGLTEVK